MTDGAAIAAAAALPWGMLIMLSSDVPDDPESCELIVGIDAPAKVEAVDFRGSWGRTRELAFAGILCLLPEIIPVDDDAIEGGTGIGTGTGCAFILLCTRGEGTAELDLINGEGTCSLLFGGIEDCSTGRERCCSVNIGLWQLAGASTNPGEFIISISTLSSIEMHSFVVRMRALSS